ncbi:sodium:solute symporter family protein [Flexithrix dorotheae]|uniref:sodium:solute symporter family protein n=1 Tax=Flexithrix dorotheae TaxID=70993 RepID=UPI000360D1D6|nr:sodium:solute symporter family protein [Flexithrix dorotheae]
MLIFSIIAYLLFTLLIGIWASRFVKNSEDFVLAGRRLPLPLAASALFATWFGSETILGSSSEFMSHGLLGVIEDPFGASLCLFLVGLFFARPLYKMKILTFGDFYRIKFGRKTEFVASLLLVPSYFGWIAAQFVAIGLLLNVVAGIPTAIGMVLGAGAVVVYTYIGGMWAISVTDFIQTIIIIGGLLFLAFHIGQAAGGFSQVIDNTPPDFFSILPKPEFTSILAYLAAWITIGLGSIPQQDIFQRVMAAKSEKVAVTASHIGGFMYLTIGFIPLFIGLCAKQLYPELLSGDSQLALPFVVLNHTNTFVQTMFFGALLSAIMSTSSGAILAPASILAENIIKPNTGRIEDYKLLQYLRLSVILVTILSLVLANFEGNIYDLVAMSSSFSLVSLFVPLIAGIYWKKSNETGALFSMFFGMTIWIIFEFISGEIPSVLPGLLASFFGLLIGNIAGNKFEENKEDSEENLEPKRL